MSYSAIDRGRIVVGGLELNRVSVDELIPRICYLAEKRVGGYVTFCNAHSLWVAKDNIYFRNAINLSNAAVADGAPVEWLMRLSGCKEQRRVSGPDFMLALLQFLNVRPKGGAIYLYGGSSTVLSLLGQRLSTMFPQVRIVGMKSPPYRDLSEAELLADVEEMRLTGADFVFVGLGCPKQELLMSRMARHGEAVMLGVGAAFDFHAGAVSRAPSFLRNLGLEWLYRLLQEPGRLWRRYLYGNIYVLRLFVDKLMR